MGNIASRIGALWTGFWLYWRRAAITNIPQGAVDQNQGQNNRPLVAVYLVKVQDVRRSLREHPDHPLHFDGQVLLEPHQVHRTHILVDTYRRIYEEEPRPGRIRTLALSHTL